MKPLYLIKNVHGTTVDLLGHAIISGRYAIGASLPPEPLLCEELGVSRTVVREAVKSLVAKGLIITGPKLGTRVLPEEHWNWFDPDVITWQSQNGLTPEFLKDLQDLRRVVEPAAVRMAAERATAVEFGGDYVTFDLRFHQGLMRASHNRMLIQMSKALGALLRTSFEISTSKKDGPKSSLPMHREVLDAVIAKEPVRAEKAILKLIDGARDDIQLILGSRKRLPKITRPASQLKAA
jgi:DNA-binding FadR family transcriptional regulator